MGMTGNLAEGDGMRTAPRTSSRTRGRPCRGMASQIDQEIIQAARELFLSLGYERTSLAMVTRAAGVSKTTLYSRYATKADLFLASVNFTVAGIANQTLHPSPERPTDLAEGLKIFGRQAIRVSLEPLWSSYERLAYGEGLRFPELTEVIAAQVDVGIQTVRDFIVDCAEADGVTLLDPDRVATAYVMALRGFYAATLVGSRHLTEAQINAYVDDLVGLMLASKASW